MMRPKAAMGLHEAVEKGTSWKCGRSCRPLGPLLQEHLGRLMFNPDCDLAIKEKGQRIYAEGRGENGKRVGQEGSGRRHFCARLL